MISKRTLGIALTGCFFVIMILFTLFIASTFLWIFITPFKMKEFAYVLSLILKKAGAYSTVLVGIAVTVFYQMYSKEKELEREDRVKIGEVGYYTLAFIRKEDDYKEEYNGDKIVVEICDEEDYGFSPQKENSGYYHFLAKFLTSKGVSTNLKNIMVFGEEYFKENQKDIINNYYKYCEKVTYASPLYCSTKPTSELQNNSGIDANRYYWLVLKRIKNSDSAIRNFWISAVTEEGIIMFIKVKVRLIETEYKEMGEMKMLLTLLQQTTYYKSQGKLCALYR